MLHYCAACHIDGWLYPHSQDVNCRRFWQNFGRAD